MENQARKKLRDLTYSVLDLVPVLKGGTAGDSIKNTVDIAQHTEKWGYKRYWLAEHHNNPGISSSATPVLIGHVAANTSKIRVGSGGVMLPNHSSLVVAEQFGTLESMFPNRIDLGLGRAPGTDQLTAQALRRDYRSDGQDFPEQLAELREYFQPNKDEKELKVRAIPGLGLQIPIWLLGSSGFSAQLAGLLGLPFSFASHFSPENTLPALALYRNSFQPSKDLDKPYSMVCVNVIAADTDEEAQRLATTLQQYHLNIIRNTRGPLEPPVDHIDSICNSYEKAYLEQKLAKSIIGGPETVKLQLERFIEETQADEIMVNSQIYDHPARLRSFKIISDILNE
ncbi:LLM class flavin-dependent oxidoreductase [Bacillus tuaregi]|uniref:LLM class flavin-dependent oxidoreductase n=1 Tax=Bacillus tuaregi TaxID=1816695 RepID=UPI0008F94D53|nr:LLM class flavin-dependent oxidoreductase [Bacillus tuaregi]